MVLDQRARDVTEEEVDDVRVKVGPGGEGDEPPEVAQALQTIKGLVGLRKYGSIGLGPHLLRLLVLHGQHKVQEGLVVHLR